MKLKSIIAYLGTFPKIMSENSTKLFALLISAITGSILVAIVIPFILIYDVITNGHVETNLTDMGVFILCTGGFIFGAGVNVKVPELKDLSNESPQRRVMSEEVDDTEFCIPKEEIEEEAEK
jgi:predicted membrane channel-forming protein YqfA (hemolysin III family)